MNGDEKKQPKGPQVLLDEDTLNKIVEAVAQKVSEMFDTRRCKFVWDPLPFADRYREPIERWRAGLAATGRAVGIDAETLAAKFPLSLEEIDAVLERVKGDERKQITEAAVADAVYIVLGENEIMRRVGAEKREAAAQYQICNEYGFAPSCHYFGFRPCVGFPFGPDPGPPFPFGFDPCAHYPIFEPCSPYSFGVGPCAPYRFGFDPCARFQISPQPFSYDPQEPAMRCGPRTYRRPLEFEPPCSARYPWYRRQR